MAAAATGMMLLGMQAGQAATMEAVCAAAASEGPVIWYTSQDPARNDAAKKAFGEQYPKIKLEVFRLATGALAARYGTEVNSGVNNASLISIGDPAFIANGLEQGWFVAVPKTELPDVAKLDDRWFHGGAATVTINVLGFSFNPSRIKGAPPKDWRDLADPKYRGELLLGDPRAIPSYMALLKVWNDELGPGFLQSLKAQNPVFVPSVVPATQQLAAGEVAIVAPNTLATTEPLINDGANLTFVLPEVTTGNPFLTAIPTRAPSPNGARCLYNFLFTPAGQVAYTGPTGVSPFGAKVVGMELPARYSDPVTTFLPEQRRQLLGFIGLQ